MSKNFRMDFEAGNKIKIKLYGDCDGSGACELVNLMKKFSSYEIEISMENANFHPFGKEVFEAQAKGLNFKWIPF